MKGRLIVCLCFTAFLLFSFYGCSEKEECPSCPQSVQKAVMFGQVSVSGVYLGFWGGIFNIDLSMPDIDMVRVAGNTVVMSKYLGEGIVGVGLEYEGPAGGIASGDTVEVQVYMPEGICTGDVVVLSYPEDEPQIIGWDLIWPYDTVALNTEMVFDWHPVENSEWYIFATYYRFADGDEGRIQNYYVTTDTTFTVPPSMTTMNGYYYIDVVAATGPRPNEIGGNIRGGYIKGAINSYMSDGTTVYIGTGSYLSKGVPEIGRPGFNFREAYETLKNQ